MNRTSYQYGAAALHPCPSRASALLRGACTSYFRLRRTRRSSKRGHVDSLIRRYGAGGGTLRRGSASDERTSSIIDAKVLAPDCQNGSQN